MKYDPSKEKTCKHFGGHDWAFQDLGDWMVKICLRCGKEILFQPVEEKDQEVDE